MHLYRIVFERFADRLYAPGFSGRWNHDGEFVIYAGSSRSLASMENMVHKMGQGILGGRFSMMIIEVPDTASVTKVHLKDLPKDWKVESHYSVTQPIGSEWYHAAQSLLLQVPSAIVPAENNFVINSRHPEFSQVKIVDREPFVYDHRFVSFDKTLAAKKREKP